MVRQGWTLTIGDRRWTESDVTLGQAVQVQELSGQPWPRPLESAVALTSLIGVLVAGGDPDLLDGAVADAARLRMVDALEMLTPGES